MLTDVELAIKEQNSKSNLQNLGKYEIEDQIAGAKWFGNQSYIDKSRIGILVGVLVVI